MQTATATATTTNPYSHLPYQCKPRHPAPFNPDNLIMTFARASHLANHSQDAAMRRVAVMYHPTILHVWIEQGYDRATIAKLLGLHSWLKLRFWLYDHHMLNDFNATYRDAADTFIETADTLEFQDVLMPNHPAVLFAQYRYAAYTPDGLRRMAHRNNPVKYTTRGKLREAQNATPNTPLPTATFTDWKPTASL